MAFTIIEKLGLKMKKADMESAFEVSECLVLFRIGCIKRENCVAGC